MSLISSLYTGATGLEANSTDLSVIGDNIANANTVGFKQSRAAFQDAMSQQMLGAGTASSQVGLGASLESIQKILTQGAISKIERKANPSLATLREWVKALGGELELVAHFGDRSLKIDV